MPIDTHTTVDGALDLNGFDATLGSLAGSGASDDTAVADIDYSAEDGSGNHLRGPQELIFTSGGSSTQVITIPTFQNPILESPNDFIVTLSDPYRAVLGTPATATATILHPHLEADSGNDNLNGKPDDTTAEALIQDTNPGKFINVQK
jgi:hypothetical protein